MGIFVSFPSPRHFSNELSDWTEEDPAGQWEDVLRGKPGVTFTSQQTARRSSEQHRDGDPKPDPGSERDQIGV